ncbi:MAG: class I SAM-dependent methyltransferase [Alistipes onderdonkii]
MGKINTAERVSREMSDNFVFQRSLLAYHAAAQRIGGDVLEIGTGAGYGIEVVAPHARSFITVDKFAPAAELARHPHVEFHQAVVPPLAFAANSFDFVISFQVIEHVKQDIELVREVKRVLKPGGKFIVTTPNAPMSLTRNPWHVREYTAEQLQILLGHEFRSVETLGVAGNGKVMDYYEQNRRSVARITRFDILISAPPAPPPAPATLRHPEPDQPPEAAESKYRPHLLDPYGGLPHLPRVGRLFRPVLRGRKIAAEHLGLQSVYYKKEQAAPHGAACSF